MSILNVVCHPERVEIAVDTDSRMAHFSAGGKAYLGSAMTSKLYPIVHLPAVMAFRGYSIVPSALFSSASCAASYDVLADNMAQLAGEVCAGVGGYNRDFRECANADYYIVLAGWSERRSRMHCSSFERTGKGPFRAGEVEFLAAPGPSEDARPRPPFSTEEHVALAAAQARRLRAQPGDPAGGGDLVICDLTPEGLSIDIVRDFAPSNARPHQTLLSRAGLQGQG